MQAPEGLFFYYYYFYYYYLLLLLLFLRLFIYVFVIDTHTQRGRDIGREKEAPCGEANVGLDPRTPGSCAEPKADALLLSHPGVP